MARLWAAGLVLFLAVSALGFAQQTQSTDEVICPRAEPPKLDGALDDACWQRAAEVSGFTKPLSDQPPRKATTARVCFDDRALYFAFECAEPQPERLRMKAQDGAPDVWKDDCVEIWIGSGESSLEYDQFICNAAGARQAVRQRSGSREGSWTADWQAKTQRGKDRWTAELAIPFATLGLGKPASGTLLQVKLGREDYAGGGHELATWPPKSRYGGTESCGRLYLETANLLPNADMAQQKDGQIAIWGFGKEDSGLFSSVKDGPRQVIRFNAPGRYSVAQQTLALKPNRVYRLDAEARGAASVYLRARTSAKKGDPSTPHSVNSKPSADYQKLELRFPSGETGQALIILGNTEGQGRGEVFIANLRICEDVSFEADGPAIPLSAGKPLAVTKVMATDCRALRGFVAAPVDGRLDSYDWDMGVWEYGKRGAGAGVGYGYRHNDGLHVTLADARGVNAVQIRGGARVKLYCGADRYDDPGKAPLVWEFKGRATASRALFAEPVKSDRFSFFQLQDGLIADVSFLRFAPADAQGAQSPSTVRSPQPDAAGPGDHAPKQPGAAALHAGGPCQLGPLREFLEKRFQEKARASFRLGPGSAQPIAAQAKQTIHLIAEPLARETALKGILLALDASSAPSGCPLTVAVQDPLNPRQELMGVDFAIQEPGALKVILDFPDQVIPAGTRLWLSLTFGAAVTVDKAEVSWLEVLREQALPEALAFRKFVMRGLFCPLSEARQWNTLSKNTHLEKFYKENHWGPGVKDLAETIAQCKALGPTDDLVRCYDEWFWRRMLDLPPFEPKIDRVPGAPEWAVLARQAWLTARAVPKWWLDNRLVPTGEFGGLVGDDTDMYQNYADFPMLESDGVGAEVKAAAAALAELAEAENLEAGLNKRTMDPLHAYEEGVNHEALMLWWFYGDPIYFERCLVAAKSMPALTVMTDKKHRHFKAQECGAQDLRVNRELGVDGGYHPLMLHPCFEVAWYNGSPKVLQFLREWGDGWLEHQRPGDYATTVDVKAEKATETGQRPLYAGGQAPAHTWLYWLTDDLRYIRPFMDFLEKGQPRGYVPELWHRGALDQVGEKEREAVLRGHRITAGIALGDKQALCDALKADIAELQRFWPMYTHAEVFTDRVFLYAIANAAMCYTGGYATRNKFNHTHAASWEGFGTDYAALVLRARRDHFKALIYNFRSEPTSGRIRLWTLDHGRYRLTLGPDADADDNADKVTETRFLGENGFLRPVEIGRATALSLTLPPKTVMVLELKPVEKLPSLLDRADLAIAAREIQVKDGAVSGVVHNIGAKDAPAFTLALLDATGKVRATQKLGPLAAPLDLEPKRIPFRFAPIGPDLRGWKLVVDPDGEVPEIFEENNVCQWPVSQ